MVLDVVLGVIDLAVGLGDITAYAFEFLFPLPQAAAGVERGNEGVKVFDANKETFLAGPNGSIQLVPQGCP